MAKISVIIPVYNVEKYLAQCLDSVTNQTLRDIEIICIDDGSPDNSGKILDEYAARDTRIIAIHQQNTGVAIARNNGLDAARGEFVCFMDPDDYYPAADILETLYNAATENNVLIAGGEMAYFKNDNPELTQPFSAATASDGYLFAADGIVTYREYQFDYGFTRFIYNREMLNRNNIRFPHYTLCEDPVFFVRAMLTAGRFYAVHKITYAYRVEYKKRQWTPRAANDFINGSYDILKMAYDAGMHHLAQRIYGHWYYVLPFIKSMIGDRNAVPLCFIRKNDRRLRRRKIYKTIAKFTIGKTHKKFKKKYKEILKY